ncbi:MAG: MATE family efflux transporter, partial [Planctomycetales bacterium]|nr:MATE family efflux transporter [Planctomycetales bacterium]
MPSSTPLDIKAGPLRPLWQLAWPVLLEQALAMMVGFSDTFLTARYLEQPHLAAMNLMAYALWLIVDVFIVVSIGATAVIARHVGAGEAAPASRAANQSLLIGGVMVLPLMLIGMALTEQLVAVMQLEGDAAILAVQYLKIVLPALPMVMVGTVAVACLHGAGDTLSGFITMGVVNLVNVLLSWALVHGWGPLPRLGWQGIAIGTTAGYVVGGVIMLGLLLRGRAGLQIRWEFLAPDYNMIRRILRIGVPGGVDVLAMIACHFWFVSIINQLGTVAAAAHGLAIRIESLSYLPGYAFQVAASTLAGQYLGAGQPRNATRAVLMSCALGGGVMCSAGLLFFFNAETLIATFVHGDMPTVQALAAPLLRLAAVGTPFLAATMILSGALRGVGDTRWPLA